MHPGTLVLNSYLGYMWWDNESDGAHMYPKAQKYPDADTHYDLGLAYKEMGLFDEAIKEFHLVRETPGRAVQCHLMIGLCHVERGKLSEAVGEFKNGLYVEGINERESLALYFELGVVYEALGDAPVKEPTLAPLARAGVTHR